MNCCGTCGGPVNDQGKSNFDPNVDIPKEINPDTGTFKKWLTYVIDAKALDQLQLKVLRYALNHANPSDADKLRDDLFEWGKRYILFRFPKKSWECGDDEPDAKSLPTKKDVNLHKFWDAEHPEWWKDEWEKDDLWKHYDESYPKLMVY